MTSDTPTVELLTRAADAAGKHATEMERRDSGARDDLFRFAHRGPSGTAHWRPVEAMFRAIASMHWQDAEGLCDMCVERFPCPTVNAVRDLAEQVLRDLEGG